ncbi:MAG: hypothetical protein KGY80_03580 [Candidatus Thorarchaeota archaeon]|nr:hypothetical protein [Candidatus Thorarchaeota archaeon]
MWTIEESKYIHGVGRGDLDFLDMDESGDLLINLKGTTIAVSDLIERYQEDNQSKKGYTPTFSVQLPQLITAQIEKMKKVFLSHMEAAHYDGEYIPLYPVKVNQQSSFLSTILQSDIEYGLEVGSKTEMLLTMRAVYDDKNRLIVCNGTKDREYLEMARAAAEQGHQVIVSLESIAEAKLTLEYLEPGKVEFALRVKPYIHSSGHWQRSGGRVSKFGLSVHDMIEVAEILADSPLVEDVRTIHAHLGSQLTDLEQNMADYGKYMAEVFFSLRKHGLSSLSTIDIGGGIPTDYKSLFKREAIPVFVDTVLKAIKDVCDEEGVVRHPNIMTEAGRVVTAKASTIIVKVLDIRRLFPDFDELESAMLSFKQKIERISDTAALYDIWKKLNYTTPTGNLEELYRQEKRIALFKKTVRRRVLDEDLKVPDSLHEWLFLPDYVAIGNFSVFNSCLDHVLVDQYFPVIPISGHDKQPATTVRLADVTCDSDGEISPFVVRKCREEPLVTKDSRPLTSSKRFETVGIPVADVDTLDYFLVALTGAYQDVLEADHNLFGNLPDVVLTVDDDGSSNLHWIHGAQAMTEILDDASFEEIIDIDDPYYEL